MHNYFSIPREVPHVATPETFKPGERWLVRDFAQKLHDVTCLEWSPSLLRVRVFWNLERVWIEASSLSGCELIERLPDESKTNQAAEPARAVEDDSELCQREDCRAIRQELTQRIIHEAAQEIAQGKTFTVATSEEIAASHKPD